MGIAIECLSWKEAESHLNAKTVVVIPLGAAMKEHGYHLQLRNDWLISEYLKQAVIELSNAVVIPGINYSYYPAFIEYPGTVSLSIETSARMITEICQGIAAFGPRKFYVINTGISTLEPLKASASELYKEGIILKYTDLDGAMSPATEQVSEQEGGSHADEIETSMMLYIAAETVRMDLASKDYQSDTQGRLRRKFEAGLCYSASGVWGDATLATQAKGEKVVKCLVKHVLQDIENLQNAPA